MKWFKKNKKRSSELAKLANKTIQASEDFLRVIENPNASPEELEFAIKAAKEASAQADKKLDEINKQSENNDQISN
jgi:hypothetical protein